MLIVNKLTIHYIPFPNFVITCQMLFASCSLYCLKYTLEIESLEWKNIRQYLLYVMSFTMCLYCNMKVLQLSSVQMVIVLRALSTICVCVVDVWFFMSYIYTIFDIECPMWVLLLEKRLSAYLSR